MQEITRLAETQRIIFVIDEYPYLAKAYKSFSSRLQHIIDHTWQNSQLFLINKLSVRGDIDAALLENFFEPSAYLFEEPENLLKQELREPAVYNSIAATAQANCVDTEQYLTELFSQPVGTISLPFNT